MTGLICMWAGAIIDIPFGWALCDGTLGTPDLRDRFIPGAGGVYTVDEEGGSLTHDHIFTGAPHDHTLQAGALVGAGANWGTQSNAVVPTGTINVGANLPLFYALAFIMKL